MEPVPVPIPVPVVLRVLRVLWVLVAAALLLPGSLGQSSPSCPLDGMSGRRVVGLCSEAQRYRSADGSCNNLRYPQLGRSNTPFLRLLKPEYGDKYRAPRRSRSGTELPSAQELVSHLLPEKDHQFPTTHLFVMLGQLVAHDFALHAGPKNQAVGPCCNKGTTDEKCFPIPVAETDPFYSQFNVTCLPVVRTNITVCNGKPDQLTAVTHFLDASLVYGSNDATARRLRQGQDGRLRVRRVEAGEFLPNVANVTAVCKGRTPCYDAGDGRVNQNPMLAALQTVLVREHNRVAGVLATMNPHWDDERLYQEARRIVVAEWQHILYAQWLPWLLGMERVRALELIPEGATPHTAYSPNLDPRTANDLTTGSFRALHGMVQGQFWVGGARPAQPRRSEALGQWFDNPGPVMEEGSGMLDTLRGLIDQQSQDQDRYMDNEVTQQYENIKTSDGRRWGNNLAAVDIQRGRDHWLPGYNKYREYVGLPLAHDFKDFLDSIDPEDVEALERVYGHVDDVDYYVGGLLERRDGDGREQGGFLFGPTFQPVVEDQFRRWRFGDRFFYNFAGFAHSFTSDQIQSLQRASMGRLLCDNVKGFEKVSRDPFVKIGYEGNEEVPCDSLPLVDLDYFKESADELYPGSEEFEMLDEET